CAGGNKCNIAYLGTDAMMKTAALGFCFGACQADTDCKGTTGNKCQKEDGLCVATPAVYAKAVGAGCNGAATTAECNCNRTGNHADGGVSPDAEKGICTHACVTGAGGNAVCNTALAGWKCTAKLPAVDSAGKPAFTGQPDDVAGSCAFPCTDDTTCATLAASSGLGALLKCRTFADGKYCDPSAD
ncbi:MAG: hypothetical protein QOI41_6103, partial [Myxococcales bacterium]|nr:hypothetical protein [Myxococcales bacterium]